MHHKKYFEGKPREATESYLKKIETESQQSHTVTVLGKQFVVLPTVFSPKYFRDPEFFVRELPIQPGETFLEVGCGAGILSIFALLKGAAHVTAIDINPHAVENTKQNAITHNVQDKITVLHGDVFSPLTNEKFDSIFWNTPWGLVRESNLTPMEQALWDTEYKSTTKFLEQASRYLNKKGRVLIGFSSTIGDMDYLKQILKENHYQFKIVAETESKSIDFSAKFEIIEARLQK